jgi:hypothetical protein
VRCGPVTGPPGWNLRLQFTGRPCRPTLAWWARHTTYETAHSYYAISDGRTTLTSDMIINLDAILNGPDTISIWTREPKLYPRPSSLLRLLLNWWGKTATVHRLIGIDSRGRGAPRQLPLSAASWRSGGRRLADWPAPAVAISWLTAKESVEEPTEGWRVVANGLILYLLYPYLGLRRW